VDIKTGHNKSMKGNKSKVGKTGLNSQTQITDLSIPEEPLKPEMKEPGLDSKRDSKRDKPSALTSELEESPRKGDLTP
jgi:hypothetical protein